MANRAGVRGVSGEQQVTAGVSGVSGVSGEQQVTAGVSGELQVTAGMSGEQQMTVGVSGEQQAIAVSGDGRQAGSSQKSRKRRRCGDCSGCRKPKCQKCLPCLNPKWKSCTDQVSTKPNKHSEILAAAILPLICMHLYHSLCMHACMYYTLSPFTKITFC